MKTKSRLPVMGLFITLLMGSCTLNYRISSTNIQDLSQFQEYGYIYALPKTRIQVEVTATCNTHIPGPYQKYADKYLGIKNVDKIAAVEWCIEDISITSVPEPDPEHIYSLQDRRGKLLKDKLLQFTSTGLMIELSDYEDYKSESMKFENREPIYYNDLSVKRNFEKISRDDGKKTISATSGMIKAKSLEMKAEEAANFLIKIRKRRFKLVAGQYESATPDGKALAVSVEELTRLEHEYLSLFIGKTQTDTLIRTFMIDIPGNREIQHITFIHFSEEKGFMDGPEEDSESLIIEIQDLDALSNLKDMGLPEAESGYLPVVYYRIPGKAKVRVMQGSKEMIEGEYGIYQLGAVVPYYVN